MKRIAAFVFIASIVLSLCACSGGKIGIKDNYRDGIAGAAIIENAVTKIALADGLTFLEEDKDTLSYQNHISDAVKIADDCSVYFTGGESFDEIGVLHCKDETTAKTVKDYVRQYLNAKAEDEVYRGYFPEEAYKLDASEVRIFGNYVAFGILSDNNRKAFFEQVEQILRTV